MKEILISVISLLGGGVVVQLFSFLNTAKATRRQANETATRTQVESLEKTINILRGQLETESLRYARERADLTAQIDSLQQKIADLNVKVETLSAENAQLLLLLGRSGKSAVNP